MDGTRVLPGSELVAKGATRKVDGQLPQVGLKEVSPNGSWLEQKQIQSALEARKHLLAVERIEKSGSLSQAVWRDDLKLAEVTKQVGGQWQYIGHKKGKSLYLLPEEALFLMEVNCLLLKHNDVTVSLQKAYALCLCEMPLVQYKVYASLSRLGYRVFRHKEPKTEGESSKEKVIAGSEEETTIKESPDKNPISMDVEDQSHESIDDSKCNVVDKVKLIENDVTNVQIADRNEAPNVPKNVIFVNPDSMDTPLVVTDSKMEINENSTCTETNKADTIKLLPKDLPQNDILLRRDDKTSFTNKDVIVNEKNTTDVVVDVNTNKAEETSVQVEEKSLNGQCLDRNSENKDSNSPTDPKIGMDDNANKAFITISKEETTENVEMDASITVGYKETTENVDIDASITIGDKETTTRKEYTTGNVEMDASVPNGDKETTITKENVDIDASITVGNKKTIRQEKTTVNVDNNALITVSDNGTIRKEETSGNVDMNDGTANAQISDVIYSVDDNGVIRPEKRDVPLDTKSTDVGVVNTAAKCIARKTNDNSSNDSLKHYEVEIKHYENKIQKLTERMANLTRNQQGLQELQDFYKERIVNINIPKEEYLPRNIFLHKAAYRLNMDVVTNQNAANVSSDEMDSIESPSRTPFRQNTQHQRDSSQYGSFNLNSQPRYSTFRPDRPPQHYYRPNYNYIYRPLMHNYYTQPRWRLHNPFIRHQYMTYNANMHGAYNPANNRRDSMKTYHYNTIFHIATRFKNGLYASESQVRALHSLLNTYNVRYNAQLVMAQDFTIIDTKNQPDRNQNVIVLDDEPKPKKPRLNEDNKQINTNLEDLKRLAAKLKDLHAKNLATSRHRRVFSNALKTFNKSFKADLYLNSDFEIEDRKLVVLDSSSDSDAVVVRDRPKKRKKLRNPYSILKHIAKKDNSHASTSKQVPVLQTLSLNVIKESTSQNSNHADTASTSLDTSNNRKGLLKYFQKAWLPSEDDFGRAEVCSRQNARLDAVLFQAEYLHDVLKESLGEFESWKHIKLSILKEMRGSLDIQRQQAEALSNDFYMETESQIQPILGKECTDLKSALKKLAIIPTNKEVPAETSLRVHFDVCNRDVPYKKTNPPMPNFRVVCYDESAQFPLSEDITALQVKYSDGVPTVFAFVGVSASISYLQINPTDLPVYIPDGLS